MAVLHLVARTGALSACLEAAGPADPILLLQDGAFAALSLEDVPNPLHVLRPDAEARGLLDRLPAEVTLTSDSDFVSLVVAHQPVVTWR